MADVILTAYRKGCIYDAWGDQMDYQKWLDSFAECGVDMDFYTTRSREVSEILPWDFIDVGVTRKFLEKEWVRALAGETTPNCRERCSACGAMRFGGGVCYEN